MVLGEPLTGHCALKVLEDSQWLTKRYANALVHFNFRCSWLVIGAQVVETSVNVISNSPSQDYTHPDDRTLLYD